MDVYYKPKSGLSWADEDEDDAFDVDTFRLSTIDTTPTLEELGPIHTPSDIDDKFSQFPYDVFEHGKAIAPREPSETTITSEPTATYIPKLPGDSAFDLSASPDDWPSQPPLAATFAHNANYECKALEAYPGLGSQFGIRYNYATSWHNVKIQWEALKMWCGQTFMLRRSLLSHELVVEDDEQVPELTDGESSEEELEKESDGALTPVDVLSPIDMSAGTEPVKGHEEANQEEVRLHANNVDTSPPVRVDDFCRETVHKPPQTGGTYIWSTPGMLAFSTGLAVGAVVGALLFRRP